MMQYQDEILRNRNVRARFGFRFSFPNLTVTSYTDLHKSSKKPYLLPFCVPARNSYGDILRLVFIVTILQHTVRLVFKRYWLFPLVLQIQLRSESQARLTRATLLVRKIRQDQLSPLMQIHTHTYSEILSKIWKRTACRTHGNTTLAFLFSSRRLLLWRRWWWHQKPQTRNRTRQQQVTFTLLHVNPIQIAQLPPNRTCSFNSRATAFLQWVNLHLLPQYSLFQGSVFSTHCNSLAVSYQTRVHPQPHGKLMQKCHANSTVSLGKLSSAACLSDTVSSEEHVWYP